MASTFSRGGITVNKYVGPKLPGDLTRTRYAVLTSHHGKLDLSATAALSTCLALADALGIAIPDQDTLKREAEELRRLRKYKAAWQAVSKAHGEAADSLVGA